MTRNLSFRFRIGVFLAATWWLFMMVLRPWQYARRGWVETTVGFVWSVGEATEDAAAQLCRPLFKTKPKELTPDAFMAEQASRTKPKDLTLDAFMAKQREIGEALGYTDKAENTPASFIPDDEPEFIPFHGLLASSVGMAILLALPYVLVWVFAPAVARLQRR